MKGKQQTFNKAMLVYNESKVTLISMITIDKYNYNYIKSVSLI